MRIILVGFGVVGQSFAQLLAARSPDLLKNHGLRPRLVAVVDRGGAAVNSRGLEPLRTLAAKREKGSVAADGENGRPGLTPLEVIEKVGAEVVVEVTPTNIADAEPGITHIKAALKSGKHVITTNKGPLALAFPALMELADYNGVLLRFSGCVGGGTPILEFARRCLLGDRIMSFRGILNGTTNYILSQMTERGWSFQEALKGAQEAGYAEADPSMDVDGYDAACKLVIMANWILNRKAVLGDVKIEGIRGITQHAIKEALRRGRKIKLLASADGNLVVSPQEVPVGHPLCVDGVLNAVSFMSEYAGEETLIGRGAGGKETASAVLRDLILIRQSIAKIPV
ncbi:homoserine dehydrogenase [Candidatus Hecatella orcuttiae]|jgi:homoserine dehydrogenase|uniref:homoserine dehydrogenase n=1 Tax=Candidatus Hecatella orcuttiae TaxID=1935119 RepID=UPI002867B3F7|nr:homoserine dehydrogenase [Candidatus Hecatella orcuttiae]